MVYPYFELGIKQDEIRKALLIKQESERFEWFYSFLPIPSVLEYFSDGASITKGVFIREVRLIQFSQRRGRGRGGC